MRRLIILLTAVHALAWSASEAAELRLRQQCNPHASVITLGDVAEIYSSDAKQIEKLAGIELFPAPAAAQQRVLRANELQDLLILRGVNLTEQRFSGSSQVVITSAGEPARADRDQNPTPATAKRSTRRLQEAISQYLQSKTGTNEQRNLQFEPTPALIHAAANPAQPITLSGGAPPWIGPQHFEVTIDSSESPAKFTLDVQVSTASALVAVAHSLARGAVIRESDVALVRELPRDGEGGTFHAIEEVIGKQTTRTIPDGKTLTPDDLQTPLMVHKGDVVTVYARSVGIRVRTTARAKDDGSLGDLVTIETIHDRKPFQARVCGMRETEVLAQAVPATERK